MKDFKCLNPICDGKGRYYARSLCRACYLSKRQRVMAGTDTWDSSKYRRPGHRGRPTVGCEIEGCANLAMIADHDNKPIRVNEVYMCWECYQKDKLEQQAERAMRRAEAMEVILKPCGV